MFNEELFKDARELIVRKYMDRFMKQKAIELAIESSPSGFINEETLLKRAEIIYSYILSVELDENN